MKLKKVAPAHISYRRYFAGKDAIPTGHNLFSKDLAAYARDRDVSMLTEIVHKHDLVLDFFVSLQSMYCPLGREADNNILVALVAFDFQADIK